MEIPCALCGKPFTPASKTNTSCGREQCKLDNNRKRSRDAMRRKRGGEPLPAKTCPKCGDPVVGRHANAVYCSDKCQRSEKNENRAPPRHCVDCGKEVGRRMKRCDGCRADEARRQTKVAKEKKRVADRPIEN